jgi:hypothetical protein
MTSANFNPLTAKYDQAFVPSFKTGLDRLTGEERNYLKHLITPEAAFLLAKAFGPDMGIYLWPFIAEDTPAELPEVKSA